MLIEKSAPLPMWIRVLTHIHILPVWSNTMNKSSNKDPMSAKVKLQSEKSP